MGGASEADHKLSIFENLFHVYYDSLLAYAYKKVNDWAVAEDLVQDVFVALWMRKDTVDFSESIKPYLYKAVYHRSLNYLSSHREYLDVSTDDVERVLHKDMILYNQQDSLLMKEVSEVIVRFVDTLPPQCQKVFKLSRMDNLKNREIAERLQISEKTVEDHIRKALKELRFYLNQQGFISFLCFIAPYTLK